MHTGCQQDGHPPMAASRTASLCLHCDKVSSGRGCPVASMAAPPMSASVNSKCCCSALPAASRACRATLVISGPMPSPGSTVMRCVASIWVLLLAACMRLLRQDGWQPHRAAVLDLHDSMLGPCMLGPVLASMVKVKATHACFGKGRGDCQPPTDLPLICWIGRCWQPGNLLGPASRFLHPSDRFPAEALLAFPLGRVCLVN